MSSRPVVHGPGEGEHHRAGPAQIVIKATSEDTNGAFFLGETEVAPGFEGPPLHRHERLTDMFYVLEGTLTVRLDGETRELEAGGFACIPPGVAHTFANRTERPVRFLNFNTPGGWERYMRDLAEAAGEGGLTPETIGQIAVRYDFHVAGDG